MTTQKGAAPLLIALVIALLLGGGGFAAMKKQELTQKHNEEESLQLLLEQAKKSPKLQDKTIVGSDWKTYNSERYGFEFTYPSEALVTLNTYRQAVPQAREERFVIEFPTHAIDGPPGHEIFFFSVIPSDFKNNEEFFANKKKEILDNPNVRDIWEVSKINFMNLGEAVFI